MPGEAAAPRHGRGRSRLCVGPARTSQGLVRFPTLSKVASRLGVGFFLEPLFFPNKKQNKKQKKRKQPNNLHAAGFARGWYHSGSVARVPRRSPRRGGAFRGRANGRGAPALPGWLALWVPGRARGGPCYPLWFLRGRAALLVGGPKALAPGWETRPRLLTPGCRASCSQVSPPPPLSSPLPSRLPLPAGRVGGFLGNPGRRSAVGALVVRGSLALRSSLALRDALAFGV